MNVRAPNPISSASILATIKLLHTVVWIFFVSCILAIWVFVWLADYLHAALSIGVVLIEVIVLFVNRWRCPFASLAERYTDDRSGNFDVYVPEWLASNTKLIFGTLYATGILFTLVGWLFASASRTAPK